MPSGKVSLGRILNCNDEHVWIGRLSTQSTHVRVFLVYLQMSALAHVLGLLDAHQARLLPLGPPLVLHDLERWQGQPVTLLIVAVH